MGNILSKFSDKKEYYFYKIYNKNNKTMYVGKTTDFKKRKQRRIFDIPAHPEAKRYFAKTT